MARKTDPDSRGRAPQGHLGKSKPAPHPASREKPTSENPVPKPGASAEEVRAWVWRQVTPLLREARRELRRPSTGESAELRRLRLRTGARLACTALLRSATAHAPSLVPCYPTLIRREELPALHQAVQELVGELETIESGPVDAIQRAVAIRKALIRHKFLLPRQTQRTRDGSAWLLRLMTGETEVEAIRAIAAESGRNVEAVRRNVQRWIPPDLADFFSIPQIRGE